MVINHTHQISLNTERIAWVMMRMWLLGLVDQLEAQQSHASALGAQVLDAVVG